MLKRFYLMFLVSLFCLALPFHITATVLWDQPVSSTNKTGYHNQDYDNDPESDLWISDDFENEHAWHISTIFVPGDFFKDKYNKSALGNAKSLSWYIYADDGGKPDGYPGDGTTPVWSIKLDPSDSQIAISTGSGGDPSNVALNLVSPPRLEPGLYWFVFSPELTHYLYGEWGRQPSDTEYGFDAQVIQPTGVNGFPTTWTSARDPIVPWTKQRFPRLTKQDFAFRLEGSSFPSNMDANPRALYFGNVLVGSSSDARIVTIRNIGGSSFVINTISSSSPGVFRVEPGSCALTNQTLTSGTSCTVSVTFTPNTGGELSAAININTGLTPATAQVPLAGTGLQAEPSITEGTIGTVITFTNPTDGFTNKKGKVIIYDGNKKINTKIAKGDWTNDSIRATVNKAFLPGTYNIRIEFKRDKDKILYDAGTFTFRKPEISSLSSVEGTPGTPVTITGNFFSTKKGQVYLEYNDSGKLKKKNCKVTNWTMNSITFTVPKTTKSFSNGTYPLTVSNKVGLSPENITFTIP
ncbi:MAG TPA: choice-of-anchor D domain-containing protein [Syntrophorhabdus sp.]|jgi:hypothetical protein|nr:choice-of-anchor D domain-containing protein [Syntrophorhabdus sp.]OPX95372.1 MAG: hypothetical protein A4E59_01804 [Syntrophorhabdus sp. PtaB.Bin027]OQB74322.1 MAG: hypothetical protein BWX92_03058 [Deltaproteobacteria bacterium ADurb.Bin135]HOD77641.1 choice-of-anchor D domain-containing protein [Syntrophorhabdus sp.]HQI95896.1 choice-of-anchor D domain-containing protein [Syntrophorhabdus sp.]